MTDEKDLPDNPFLAQLYEDADLFEDAYGEQEEETLALLAEANVLLELFEEEGIDVFQLTDEQVAALAKGAFGEDSTLHKKWLSKHTDLMGRVMAHSFIQEMEGPQVQSSFDPEAILKEHMKLEDDS